MLNNIEYVYMIYKERSFTKAAEKLYVSQPALSLAITKLEKRLGYPLFERRGKECVPTEYGEKYIAAIERIKRIQDDLEHEIEEMCRAVRFGEPISCDVLEGAKTVAVGLAIVESARLGGVAVKPNYDFD